VPFIWCHPVLVCLIINFLHALIPYFDLSHLLFICVFINSTPSLSFIPFSTLAYPTKFKQVLG
jgi:hypothetical protein